MKIEMAESLMRSWLRHVRSCEFAELNWKPSLEWSPKTDAIPKLFIVAKTLWPEAFGRNSYEQLMRQAEVDVLGFSVYDKKLYFIDVAFHLGGLNYGNKITTAMRVYKKLVRSALLVKRHFPDQSATILFVSPFTNQSDRTELDSVKDKLQTLIINDESIKFELILTKNEFKEGVIEPLLLLGNSVTDTSELFLRSWQLVAPFYNIHEQEYELEKVIFNEDKSKQHMSISEVNRKDLLITALYLAKFGHLNKLGLGNQSQVIQSLASIIGCSSNSLRGYRDRYDRYVDSPRVGYDLPLSDELMAILSKFKAYSEEELRILLPL